MIKASNLSYIYNKKSPFRKAAINDVSFEVEEGDFFGIIGHTGSGKSTLILHLNGLVKMQSGQLQVGGIDLSKRYDYRKLREIVGMVFQYAEVQLFDSTIERDVGYGPRNLKLSSEEIDRRVREAIGLVGLDFERLKERSPFEISGGQMRRVALAGVLAMRPKILVLDEPTAGLDPAGRQQILSLINSLKKQIPIIIMISHNMDEVFSYCNKIAVLDKGSLKGVFTPHQLYKNSHIIKESGLLMPSVFNVIELLKKDDRFKDLNAVNEAELCEQIAGVLLNDGGNKQ